MSGSRTMIAGWAANDNEKPTSNTEDDTIDAETLLGMEFPPLSYVIPGYVVEGRTILGGSSFGRLGACADSSLDDKAPTVSLLTEITLTALTTISPLSFPLQLAEGTTMALVGDAANYVGKLSEEQRERFHWVVAIRMLDHAPREPRYLKTATISFQTALALDGVLAPP